MATRVLLLSRPCVGADQIAHQLRARFYEVEVRAPDDLPEETPDLLVIYGGSQWAATLAELGHDHPFGATPTLLLVADASLQGSALLGHWGIDECLSLPIFEDALDQIVRQMLVEGTRLNTLRQQWPPQLPMPTPQAFDPDQWPFLIIDDDGHTSARCQLSLEAKGMRVTRLTWEAFSNPDTKVPPTQLVMANPAMGSLARSQLKAIRNYVEALDSPPQFIALADHEADILHRDRLLAAGARRVVTKPLSQAYLLNLIERLAVGADYERQLRADLQKLRDETSRDELTGLMNRQAAHRLLTFTPTMTLAVLDLNNLKTINDRLGHLAGDAAIRAVGQGLLSAFEGQGRVLVRWGGDEFMVYAQDQADFAPTFDRVLRQLAMMNLDSQGRRAMSPSFSYGIAQGHEGEDFAAVMALADQRLYVQKAQKKGSKRNPSSKETYGIVT